MSYNKITTDMIQKFTILDPCYESFPCQHDCTIELRDGTKRDVRLFSPCIEALIKKIPNIDSAVNRHHFSNAPNWGDISTACPSEVFEFSKAGPAPEPGIHTLTIVAKGALAVVAIYGLVYVVREIYKIASHYLNKGKESIH